MFSLIITGEILTLRYEVSPVRRLLFIAGGLAGVGVAAFETAGAGGDMFQHSHPWCRRYLVSR